MKKKLTVLTALAVFFLINSCTTQVENKVLKPTSSSNEAIELFEKARVKMAEAKEEEALELLNQVIELDEGFAIAYIYKILVDGSINNIYQSNVEKALEYINAVSPDEQLFLKIFKSDIEKQGEQLKLYMDSIQKIFPDDVWVNYMLGTFNFNRSREEKEHFLARAIELDSNFIPAYTELITYLSYTMELNEAMKYAEKYIEIRPEDGDPYLKMGTIFRQQNELEKALDHYKKAVEINPEDKLSNILLANCYVFLGNFEKAHELYQKSYELQEQPVYKRVVLNNIAVARVFEGDKEKAINGFEKIHEFNIENGAIAAAVYNRFSQAYTSVIMGDFILADKYMNEARTEFDSKELTEGQKSNINEAFDMWMCYFECLKGNIAVATELADNYMNIAKKQNLDAKLRFANLFHGIIAVKKSNFNKALEYLANGPEDYLSWYYMGIAYQELGQTEKAVEQFSKINSANLINMNLASVKKDAVSRMKMLTKS